MATQRMQLKMLRRKLAVKLDVVSALSGVSVGTVSRVLAGKRAASPDVVDRIAATLNAIAKIREGFAATPLDLTDVRWLRAKIKELDQVQQP